MATYTSQPDDTSGIDTWIRADSDTNQDLSDVIPVGRYSTGTQVDRALLKFDLSTIPTLAIISSATLTLTIGYQYDAAEVQVYRSKRAWVESEATWTKYSTGNNWATAGGMGAADYDSNIVGTGTPSANTTGTALAISLNTSLVTELINGTMTNNGFIIKGTTEGNNTLNGFSSSSHATSSYRPKLVIEYLYGGNVIIWSS